MFWLTIKYELSNNLTEKMQRDLDTLTPLDARNSLLLDRKYDGENFHMFPMTREKEKQNTQNQDRYSDAEEGHQSDYLSSSPPTNRNLTAHDDGNNARTSLIDSAAPMGWADRAPSPIGQGRYDNYGSNGQSYGYGHGQGTGGGYRGF